MSWLTDVLIQHQELESPRNFWYWAGLAALSAILRDNVWINRQGVYNLYPNIYVMLHADSGLKKGPPINMAKKLVKAVGNTRIISGRSSIQGILKKLGTAQTTPGGFVDKKSIAFICSSELTSSIVEDKAATTILTDLFDRNYNEGEWESLLKMETFKLVDPTISMLTATNEAHGEEFFMKKDVQGGYFARTFIIYENKRNVVNSLMDSLINPPNYEKLACYLKEVAKLKGEFEPTPTTTPVGRYYDEWYHSFIQLVDAQSIRDPTGTLNRFGDSVLKIAMLLSIAEQLELKITMTAMIEAIEQCEKLVGNIRKATLGQGKSATAQHKAMIIRELLDRSNHIISREMLNKKYWMQASSVEWDEIMSSLEAAGIIKIVSAGHQVMYEMPAKVVEEWTRHLKGKNN